MPETSLRFAVRNSAGDRAATWKMWNRKGRGKNDVYLACRSLGGSMKASLHDSGSWHVGFLRDFVESEIPDDDPKHEDPYIDRWPRPKDIAPGVTLAYRIVVPTVAVNIPITEQLPASIEWIPAAPEGRAVEIDIVFTAAGTKVTSWPGRNAMKSQLVGKLELDNGDTVWVVHRITEVPPLPSGRGRITQFKSSPDVDITDTHLRAIVFGKSDDDSRMMIECLVRPEQEAS
jgi:hypothetical protein